MPLSLVRRTAQIGPSINSRTQKHGEEDVGALDIPLAAIVLDANNFDAINLEASAHDRLFIEPVDGPIRPLFEFWGCINFEKKIEDVWIEFYLGRRTLTLPKVKLAHVRLLRLEGGMTHMSCTVQCLTADVGDSLKALIDHQNKQIEFALECPDYGVKAEASAAQPEQGDFVDGPLDKPIQTAKRGRGRPRKEKPQPQPLDEAVHASDGEDHGEDEQTGVNAS